jgi:hypothetical protein
MDSICRAPEKGRGPSFGGHVPGQRRCATERLLAGGFATLSALIGAARGRHARRTADSIDFAGSL